MKSYNQSEIGARCREYRRNAGYTQWCVARDTGYSIENVSKFEHGHNDNMCLLLWYVAHGMSYEDIIGVCENGKK